MDKNKRKTGAFYEQRAAEYLEECGYRILARNYRCRYGEIDLVASERGYLVFVEVKYRKNDAFGEGEWAVNRKKQQRISLTARWYLMEHRLADTTPCRFDVVAVEGTQIRLVRNAFPCI